MASAGLTVPSSSRTIHQTEEEVGAALLLCSLDNPIALRDDCCMKVPFHLFWQRGSRNPALAVFLEYFRAKLRQNRDE